MTGETGNRVSPTTDLYLLSVERTETSGANGSRSFFRLPLFLGLLSLHSFFVEMLAKVAFAVEEGDTHHWNPQMSC